MPSGLTAATFELTWDRDWTWYPTNDLDLIVIDPDGNYNFDGATLNGHETAIVGNPKPGTWLVLIDGFDVFGKLAIDGTETGPKFDTYRVRIWAK